MFKKMKLLKIILGLLSAVAVGFIGLGMYQSVASAPHLDIPGYILQSGMDEVKQIAFSEDSSYKRAATGEIRVSSGDGATYNVARESFAYMEGGVLMPLSDGVLLDFEDLTDNFVNNYYISAGLCIQEVGNGSYMAETTAGTMQFGEYLLKLSDSKYIIQAGSLKVSLRSGEEWPVNDYVQVSVSPDGIIYLLTPENTWSTISEDCYIETGNGVKIYPVTQLVNDGTHKLSLAKMNVDMDDAIVLTEAETKRQIVPQLNITAIDGENGANGTDGNTGAAGQTGNAGEAGKDGEAGKQGKTGVTGDRGSNGSNGNNGASGPDGSSGNSGGSGATGTKGADAVVSSSTNTVIPTMTITDWDVNAKSVRGAISIDDPSSLLAAMAGTTGHPGRITLTNTKTGEIIICHEWNEQFTVDQGEDFSGFYNVDTVYFASASDLTPDTEYELSVTAYYTSTDNANLIYSREFINRIFYTDSTGVNLSKRYASVSALYLNATLADSHAGSISNAEVYLLTPEQNRSFTAASRSNPANYVAMANLNFSSLNSQDIEFTGLDSNSTYIARVFVQTTSGLNTLTRQELQAQTLKRAPSWLGAPIMGFNRQTGALEAFRPIVNDPDGGAVRYVYSAYPVGGTTPDLTREIGPVGGDPVEFRLNSGQSYYAGVKMEFFDNEKTVWYDLGQSDSQLIMGDTMPRLSLVVSSGAVFHDYDEYVGKLHVSLGANSHLRLEDPMQPLSIEMYADSLMLPMQRVDLSIPGTPVPVYEGSLGYMTLAPSSSSDYVDIILDLHNLHKNTTYSLSLYGWLDLGDGNGEKYRNVGTVTFITKDMLSISVSFTSALDSVPSARLAQKITMNLDSSDPDREAYAESKLTGGSGGTNPAGRVSILLSHGVGLAATPIAQKNFEYAEDLAEFFGSGKIITEADFGNPNIDSGANYTLTITEVADSSYSMTNLGYVNTYEDIRPATGITSGNTQPPDLLSNPANGIRVTDILNKDAELYGGTVNLSLPDDAVVGYVLAAQYSNIQRLATNVKYYAYEASAFLLGMRDLTPSTSLGGKTPLEYLEPFQVMSQPVSSADNAPPKVAIMFGVPGTPKTENDEDAVFRNGCMVYWAGTASYPLGASDPSLSSGMGRGFRYVFGYEVEYKINDNRYTYPYDHGKYNDYQSLYGGFLDGASSRRGSVYVLSSGICDAPRVLPDFHTYIYETNEDAISDPSGAGSGRVIVHYTWRDAEADAAPGNVYAPMIKDTTTISFLDAGGASTTQLLNEFPVAGAADWYSIALPYNHTRDDKQILSPKLSIGNYVRNYSAWGFSDSKTMTMGPFPVDWSWEKMFGLSGYDGKVVLVQSYDTSHNMIEYTLANAPGAASNATNDLASRATALSLKFTAPETTTKSFCLPVIYDATTDKVCVQVMASQLTDFIGKTYTVSDAVLYYDNGKQGLNLIHSANDSILLQRVSDLELASYVGGRASGNPTSPVYIPASGSMARTTSGTSGTPAVTDVSKAVRETINLSNNRMDQKLLFTRISRVDRYGSESHFAYPRMSGLDFSSNSDVKSQTGSTVTVKGVSAYPMAFEDGSASATGSLTGMTPTVVMDEIVPNTSEISFRNLRVNGMGSGGTIYIRLYNNILDALGLTSNYGGLEKDVAVPDNGRVDSESSKITSGITPNTTYYLAMYYITDGGGKQLLIDEKTNDSAVYPVRTSDGNTITIKDINYTNASYFDKQLSVKFSLSLVMGQSFSYDIYSTDALAASGGEPDVMSYAALKNDNLITVPSNYSLPNNEITFDLTPSYSRSVIEPGVTYYLRITSFEGSLESGHVVVPFTLGRRGSYGALISATSANSNSVSFQVTIVDEEHTLMGYRTSSTDNGDSLYAVRFTDSSGNRIFTTFDNETYKAFEVLQRTFVLNGASCATGRNPVGFAIAPNTEYQLLVYAVPDANHDGRVSLGDSNYTWSQMFEGVHSEFQNLLNSFWNAGGTEISSMNAVENQMLIAQKRQRTTAPGGWLLNKSDLFAKRLDSTHVRIILKESFNLINGASHVFNIVDWQVQGKNPGGYLIEYGTSKKSNGQEVIQYDDTNQNYYFDIPAPEIPEGEYTIILNLYENEASLSPENITWNGAV